LNTNIESASVPVLPEVQELVLLETLKALLTAAIRALSRGEPAGLAEVSRDIHTTAADVLATSLNLGRFPLTPEAQRQRQKLLAEMRQQRAFCRAMLRRWRRSILLRRQLLDLATGPAIYREARWSCHE
jgi:hypothetical protein